MWKCAATAILCGSSAMAGEYACEGWSIAAFQEGGPVTVSLSSSALTWSNGTISRTAANVVHGDREWVYHHDGQIYIVPEQTEGLTKPTIHVRRINSSGANPVSDMRCTLLD